MEQNIYRVETFRNANPETFAGGQLKEAWKPKIELPDVAAQNNKDMGQLGEVRLQLAQVMVAPQREIGIPPKQPMETVAKRMSARSWDENKEEIDARLQIEPKMTRFSEKLMRAGDTTLDKMDHLVDLLLVKLGIMSEEDLKKQDEAREQASKFSMISRDMLRNKGKVR